jgi:hypothetical protein
MAEPQEQTDHGWPNEKGNRLDIRWHEGGDSENPEEPKVGAWVGVDLEGISRPARTFRTDEKGAGCNTTNHNCSGNDVLINRLGKMERLLF